MTVTTPDATVIPTPLQRSAVLTARPSSLRRAGRSFGLFVRRSPMSALWGLVAVAVVLMAVAAPVIAPYDPLKSNFRSMTKPPSAQHTFGTDQIGRDTLSRVVWGSRASLTVAFFAVLLGTTTGALWGLACGFFGGRFDIASQRAIEFMQAFPDLVLAMAIAMALGAGTGHGHRRHRHHPHSLRRARHPLGGAVAEGDAVSSRRRAGSGPPTCA